MNRAESLWRSAILACFKKGWPAILLVAALLAVDFWNLNALPIFWDEGWTLTVARSWVERGHYGMLLVDQPAPPGLSASFVVVAPIALSFRMFGVGLWQGRLPSALYTLGALAFIYYLSRWVYNARLATGTLLVLLFMSIGAQLNPVVIGQLALGEMPSMFYLLAGYASLFLSLRRSSRWLIVAMLCWGIALSAKAQVLPFWATSMVATCGLLLLLKPLHKPAILVAATCLGALLVMPLLNAGVAILLRGHTLPTPALPGLYEVTALVVAANPRQTAARIAFTSGLLAMCGIIYVALQALFHRRTTLKQEAAVERAALLVLAASWYAWYLLLSVGIERYLFPAVFVGAIFVAKWLYDLTGQLSLSYTVKQAAELLLRLRLNRATVGALLAIFVIAVILPLGVLTVYQIEFNGADASALQVSTYLNSQTAPGSVVESYDSEIFFALDRPYHFPPDELNVDLIRRSMLRQYLPVTYDPLAADPDYLVVGPFSSLSQLYDRVLAINQFRLIRTYNQYEVYKRVR